ncbi:hypothetical protein BDL97_U04700 [Sphagnum fallax]|nr:hypothetical protein BDL97_U04700 [Sphagnum fallax]
MAQQRLKDAGSLYAWLTTDGYVRGRDETAAVLSRKKCRSRRRASSGTEDAHKESEQQQVKELSSKLSNRRYRRWMNDKLLRELAPPLDAFEIGALFAPPPWVAASAHDMALWEPFRNNVDMDLQEKVRAKGKEGGMKDAMTAWNRVERNLRGTLRRVSTSPLVEELEERLVAFIGGEEKELLLEAELPYHRLLLHGLSQFHGLVARTVQTSEDENGNMCYSAGCSLPQFLGEIRQSTPTAAAA